MAWTKTRQAFGVCGNFRFKFYDLTDVKATKSLINPCMQAVYFVNTTNTTDAADTLIGGTLNWAGTADTNTTNKLVNTSETFDPEITDAQAFNTTDNLTSYVSYDKDATTALFCHKGGTADAVYDLAPDGNEVYEILSDKIVQVTAVSANDDGTILIIGR